MSDKIQRIAGLWCTEVLEQLQGYVDGDLDAVSFAMIEGHLSQCTWCEQFGGRYSALVQQLRDQRDNRLDDSGAFASIVLERVHKEIGG